MQRAFSMIELIFIIVIIGILASAAKMAMPDTRLYSDSDFILQKIEKTRIRALMVDHSIAGDESWRTAEYNDTCIQLNKDYFTNLENNTNNPKKYRLSPHTTISASISKVCFDNLARPYQNNYLLNNFLKMPIELNISYSKKTKQVLIMPFSGSVVIKR